MVTIDGSPKATIGRIQVDFARSPTGTRPDAKLGMMDPKMFGLREKIRTIDLATGGYSVAEWFGISEPDKYNDAHCELAAVKPVILNSGTGRSSQAILLLRGHVCEDIVGVTTVVLFDREGRPIAGGTSDPTRPVTNTGQFADFLQEHAEQMKGFLAVDGMARTLDRVFAELEQHQNPKADPA